MRQLRFVRLTEDAGHLVVATADGNEQFSLLNDGSLRDAVRSEPVRRPAPATTAPAPSGPATEVQIGPREVQVRIRAGESPQSLADSLGASLERVMRFAAPVLEERLRIADEARRARARRSTTEGQTVVFGEAVDARFTAHGIAPADITWDARRRDDGDWVIEAGWLGGEGRHTAEWAFHRTTRTVTPIDDAAADLLSDHPIRPMTPAPIVPERPSLAAAPPLAPGVVAFPPMPDAHTGPLPKYEDVFDQNAPAEGPRDVVPLVPAAAGGEFEFDAPPLPLGITDPSTRPAAASAAHPHPALSSLSRITKAKREESEDDRAARARVPSWDDILLGVRRKQD